MMVMARSPASASGVSLADPTLQRALPDAFRIQNVDSSPERALCIA